MSGATAKPLFIALEGIDGSGTTTQAARLAAHLVSLGRAASVTREPSGGPVGRLLREILLGQHRLENDQPPGERTMALLFAADRSDHIEREVRPLLARNTDVITDRYLWSSLAYQSEDTARGWVEGLALGLPRPDLTLLIEVPVGEAATRRRLAGRPHERYDEDAIQERVARAYRILAASDPAAVVIDGRGDVEDVAARINRAIGTCLDRSPAASARG